MSKKNAWIAKQAEKRSREELIVKLWTTQLCMDALMLALNDSRFVGKDVFGRERLKRLSEGITEYYNEILVGTTADVRASHVRRQVDDRLRDICGEYFQPWEERYEYWDDNGI